jgi:two-component system, NtrC family, response regulator AtoC
MSDRRGPREADSTQTIKQEPSRHPRLVAFWDGGATSAILDNRGRWVVGRSKEADIVVDHSSISRRHAAVEIDGGVSWADLGSANGTWVRGQALRDPKPVRVDWAEPVQLGGVVVIVRPPLDHGYRAAASDAVGGHIRTSADVERWIDRVAPTDMSVLFLGETGVGKGYFARRVHERSPRADKPWVHINCAALPEHLLESELFGHERGAFTGAVQAKAGLLESADGGTVFLDEVGELPLGTQSKLLVALEQREVLRVGGLKPRPFDVRFVSATNRDLSVRAGAFRPDLYYRLAGLPIVVPPLRDRPSEIEPLVRTFVAQAATKLRKPEPLLSRDALDALERAAWPGNVRELAMVVERALLWCGDTLHATHVADALAISMGPTSRSDGSAPVTEQPSSSAAPSGDDRDDERRRVVEALDQCAGNQSRAAKLLGISRRTLVTRIEEFGLKRPRK